MDKPNEVTACPVCSKDFPTKEIEIHVNKCLFLNTAVPEISPSSSSKRPNFLIDEPNPKRLKVDENNDIPEVNLNLVVSNLRDVMSLNGRTKMQIEKGFKHLTQTSLL